MKIGLTLFLIGWMSVSANVFSQDQTLTLHTQNITLHDLFKEIEKKSNYRFFYNDELVNIDKKVSIDVKDIFIDEILDRLLSGTNLKYKRMENNLIVVSSSELLQQVVVSGKVTDETGEPMPGVNVVIKGTSTGVVTDYDGKYSINVSDRNTVLQFSFMGYVSQELTVGNRTGIDIILSEDLRELEEVVVIGYGSVKKSNLTSSVSKIDDKAIQDRPVSTLSEVFQGQLAGVRAQSASGVPGQDMVIRIRGVNTINGDSSPLYVIDGVPRDNMNDLNPTDIASIQVLKDAAATSIYGARGGNGVIVIETKRGAGRPTITLDAYYGWQEREKAIEMMNKEEWITYNAWLRNVSWLDSGGSMSDPMSMRPASQQVPDEWFQREGTDWQEAISQVGIIQNYQLAASGQNDMGSIYISGGYFDQKGVVKETYYNRFNFRLNASLNIGKRARVGVNIAPSFSDQDKKETEGKELVIHHALLISPLVGVNEATRDWGFPTGIGNTYPNPLERLKYTTDRTKRTRLLSSVWGEIDIIDGLTFRSQYSYNTDVQNYEFFQPGNVTYANGNVTRGNSNSGTWTGWSIQNTLTYDKSFGNHGINIMAGQSAEDNKSYRIYATATGWQYETLETLNLASTPTQASTTRSEYSTASFFGRASYDYKEKYLLTTSVRYDGSSRFGTNNKWGVFPAVSGGWKINEESFMENAKWISLLKIRASWGMSGNDRIGNYDYMALLGSYKTSWGNAIVTGTAPSNIENPNLQWEATKTTDIGFDFSGFNNRLQASFDYYINITDKLLFNVPIPYTTGFTTFRTNLGSIENKGWEIDLTSYNLTGDFKWSTSLNFSSNKNKVKDMGDVTQLITSSWDAQFITEVGGPVSSFYLYRTDGVLTADDFEADGKTAKVPIMSGQRMGNMKFVDQPTEEHPNGDGMINSDDLVSYGSNLPDLMYGMTNRFSWKNFELSVLVQGQIGGNVMFLLQRQVDVGSGGLNQRARWLRQWKPDYDTYYSGRGNPIPDYYNIDMSWDGETYNRYGANNNNTDMRVYDATYFRIKNITFSYSLPKRALEKIRMKNVRLYFSADNLKTFDNYPGATPETNSGGNSTTQQGVDYSTYPLSRRYTLGVNVTF